MQVRHSEYKHKQQQKWEQQQQQVLQQHHSQQQQQQQQWQEQWRQQQWRQQQWWQQKRLGQQAQSIGQQLVTKGPLAIVNQGQLSIGENCKLLAEYQTLRLAVGQGATLQIGDNCTLNSVIIAANQAISIGNGCQLAPFVHLMDSDFHDLYDRNLPGPAAPICLEDNVRLGARTIVLRGVTIGRGSEILPGSVVTKSIPAGVLAGGVPAKVMEQI